MKVKIKRLHPNAEIPKYATEGDAGMDLVATSIADIEDKPYIEYGTGIAVEIPEGYVGLIYPRSSISKTAYMLANSVGVIDSGYRGEIKFRFKTDKPTIKAMGTGKIATNLYQRGDKIGQLIIMPYPKIEFEEVEELSDSARDSGGFGSKGK